MEFIRLKISSSAYKIKPTKSFEELNANLKIAKTVHHSKPDVYHENYNVPESKVIQEKKKQDLKISKSVYVSDRPGYGDWHSYMHQEISSIKGYKSLI